MSIYKIIVEDAGVSFPSNPLDTPAFKAWFGRSKVVDDQGRPLKVFHGTSADIGSFQHSHNGAGSRESRLGFWFTESTLAANDFAAFARQGDERYPNVVPVYLSIQNPWYPKSYAEIRHLIDRNTKFARPGMLVGGEQIRMVQDKIDYDAARAELRAAGHDGIALMNTKTDSPNSEPIHQFVILKPSQAKSVLNRGGFDPDEDHLSEERDDKYP